MRSAADAALRLALERRGADDLEGAPELAVAMAQLDCGRAAHWRSLGRACLDALIKEAGNAMTHTGLFGGAAGLAWTLCVASSELGLDSTQHVERLDGLVLDAWRPGAGDVALDFVSGAFGVAYYAAVHRLQAPIFGFVHREIERWQSESLATPYNAQVGVAHGISGGLVALGALNTARRSEILQQHMQAIVSSLAALVTTDCWSFWPSRSDENEARMTGWCSGNLAVAGALAQIENAMAQDLVRRFVRHEVRARLSADWPAPVGPDVCCGAAGHHLAARAAGLSPGCRLPRDMDVAAFRGAGIRFGVNGYLLALATLQGAPDELLFRRLGFLRKPNEGQ